MSDADRADAERADAERAAGAPSAPPLDPGQFPVRETLRYLNHASVAPLPRAAVDAGRAFLDDALHHGARHMDRWEARAEEVRTAAARLMGVPAPDVAFVKNTTEGLAFVANGLDWRPGDRVIAPARDFPSTVYPWLALRDRGVTVDLVEPVGDGLRYPVDAVEEALAAEPTRVVAVSWVHFGRGWRIDLADLAARCRRHGALLCVDVIQGLGVLPADLAAWGADFAAADAHKWLLGPQGTGVLYVAGHRRDLLRPLEPGWASVAHQDDFDHLDLTYRPTARRFEGGTVNYEGIAQMGASIDLLLGAGAGAGVNAIWAHVDGLLDRLAAGLTAAGATVLTDRSPEGRSGILTFGLADHDPIALCRALAEEGFALTPRGGGVRVSPHGYTTADEIDALVAAVAARTRT